MLNVEGLWTRYEDPTKVLEELAGAATRTARATKRLQEVYAEPIKPELIAERVREHARRRRSPSPCGCPRSTPWRWPR